MAAERTKKENLEAIKKRLNVHSLPSKFKALPQEAIAIFADHPELDSAIQVIIDQNNTIKNANGRRLWAEEQVKILKLKLDRAVKDFVNPSKSEIVQLWGMLFGKTTKADDDILRQIGAVSGESVREDLDKAEKIVEESIDIANKYRKKYGEL